MTATTTAAQIIAANATRGAVILTVISGTIYLGSDSGVNAANGFPLSAGGSASLNTTDAVWAIAASGSVDVRYLEET